MCSYYKYCFVPMCSNTTFRKPEKKFVCVPGDEQLRKKWFQMARRKYLPINKNTRFYCCIDHFSYPEDFDNYVKHSLTNCFLKVKKGVYPHLFECHGNRSPSEVTKKGSAVGKRKRKEVLGGIFKTSSSADPCSSGTKVSNCEDEPMNCLGENNFAFTTQPSITQASDLLQIILETGSSTDACYSDSGVSHCEVVNRRREMSYAFTTEPRLTALSEPQQYYCSVSTIGFGSGLDKRLSFENILAAQDVIESPGKNDFSVNAEPCVSNMRVGPFKPATQNIKSTCNSVLEKGVQVCLSPYGWSSPGASKSSSEPDSSEEASGSGGIISLIRSHPQRYTGLNKKHLFLVKTLSNHLGALQRDIFICLMKIRLNDSFSRLGHQFHLGKSAVFKIFNRTIVLISHMYSSLIRFDDVHIKLPLPTSLPADLSDVRSVIDCFEIEIEKPADPVHDALSWSESKKCNTIKYLISCTPHGCINFISKGFGGSSSDKEVVLKSGYLDRLPHESLVMADGGFEDIEHLLIRKGCRLVRPSSLSAGVKSNKELALRTKQITALTIHLERLTQRYRQFAILQPQSIVENSLINKLDDILIVASSLINLQPSIS